MENLDITRRLLDILGLGEERIEFVADRPGHDFRYAIDFSKAKEELGWEPVVDFDEGLRRTVAWYKENLR